ncbi:AraC family transcriptional regulator [Catalinimonas niigatensis]|uniref:AraC family transcriptional regulator n=1 Tax=Catalinimonas niigatensis TaxID=1397264 RepID=UPI002665C08B|nr:helix-turn-helix domain-containing protein [Catalinimonas niigatensis]WPP50464.1 helix-turn-helix domain-containing protein [Catalinimonas niigatensis]
MPEPSLDWLAVINLLGVAQGLFLAVIFFTVKKGNRRANRFLGLSLLVMAFIVFEVFLGYTGYLQYLPVLVNLEEPVVFLIGPLTYFYTLALLHPDFKFRWKWHGWHLIPFFFQSITRMPFFLQSNAFKLQDTAWSFHQPVERSIPAEKIWYFPKHEFLVSFWLDVVTISLIFLYLLFSFRLIYRHTQQRQESLWKASDPSLRWLTRILALFSVFLLISTFFSFTSEDDTGDIYIASGCSFIFYGLSFYLISHLQEFGTEKQPKKKYERSVLDTEMAEGIRLKLEKCMHSNKPYLNPDLTMPTLADQLKVSHHHLSQVINEQYGLNFSDFINQHRIEEIKRRLADPAYHHIKIEQIAFDTGFNSKSTFQAAFKKFTGTTPSAYRKNIAAQA